MSGVLVGISGWSYPPWRGNFFPRGLPHRLELAYAARRFNALEVNGTFYSLQRPSSFAAWYDESPPGFTFALKGGRFITHMTRLQNPQSTLANFFASGPLRLREKLGPILWQLPANFRFDAARLREFFDALPRDTVQAARVARGHDAKLKGRVWLEADACRPIRHALEFRHESFRTDAFIELLRACDVALVVADAAGHFPIGHDVTSDFVYVRLHGSRKLYASGYRPREIETWAERIEAWHGGGEPADARLISPGQRPPATPREVFVFFDNTDVKLRAPVDARKMARRLGVAPAGTPSQVVRHLARS